jgi:hypothetical protein
LPDRKTGFWRRGTLFDGKILLFFLGGSELPSLVLNPSLSQLIFSSIDSPSWSQWHLKQWLHVEHGFTRHRHIDISRACKFLEQANCSTSLYFKLTEGIPKSTPFPLFTLLLRFSILFFPYFLSFIFPTRMNQNLRNSVLPKLYLPSSLIKMT